MDLMEAWKIVRLNRGDVVRMLTVTETDATRA
jgi:hypothetical protein